MASNDPEPPADPVDPNSPSCLHIFLTVNDINDEPPKFNVPNNIISAGISTALEVKDKLKPSYWINATDLDIGDLVTYRILNGQVMANHPSLDSVMRDTNNMPFILRDNATEGGADLFIDFKPQPAHEGYFSFMIQACDSMGDCEGNCHM